MARFDIWMVCLLLIGTVACGGTSDGALPAAPIAPPPAPPAPTPPSPAPAAEDLLPKNALPMRVDEPLVPRDPHTPQGFACYGGCGPSCQCAGKEVTTEQGCAEGYPYRCLWQITRCKTHEFCRWHDECYLRCNQIYPGVEGDEKSMSRAVCYRDCDASCVLGTKPIGSVGDMIAAPPARYSTKACIDWARASDNAPFDGIERFAETITCQFDPSCPAR
jgi:hypothetical protein